MIANADFSEAGAAPGEAFGWTLRSACAREQVAAFGPAPFTSSEEFERWTRWAATLGAGTFAPFAPNGTRETFDAWPAPVFATELVGGLVAARTIESFDGWATPSFFAWNAVPQVPGTFAGGARVEVFAVWRPGEPFVLSLPEDAFARAVFHGVIAEFFEAWTTQNTTV